MSKRAYTKANVSNSYKSWTMREDGRIREMYLQGVKATEIGRILGRRKMMGVLLGIGCNLNYHFHHLNYHFHQKQK